MYKLLYSKAAQKDAKKIKHSGLKEKVIELLEIIKNNPFASPPAYKSLKGKYSGMISRRINLQHRLFYLVESEKKIIKILRMWTHYGDN